MRNDVYVVRIRVYGFPAARSSQSYKMGSVQTNQKEFKRFFEMIFIGTAVFRYEPYTYHIAT